MATANRRLYVFDMDGTLLPSTTSCLEVSKHLGFYELQVDLELQLKSNIINNRDFSLIVRKIWQEKNINESLISKIFELSPKLTNIEKVLQDIHEKGHMTCLITQSSIVFASQFKKFGFDYIFGSLDFDYGRKEINLDKILMPKHKPEITRDICKKYGINFHDCVAFGDSSTDVPLFQNLQHTVSVNGDDTLKPHAKYHYDGLDLHEAYSLISEQLKT